MLVRQAAAMAVILLSVFLGLSGCVVLPRYTKVQPAISFRVVDLDQRTVSKAEFYFLRHEYLYGFAVRTDRYRPDEAGMVRLPVVREWQAIMPFIIHGMTAYSWSWCAQAPGVGPEVGRVPEKVPDTPIEVTLRPSRTRYRCEDFKQGLVPLDFFRPSNSRLDRPGVTPAAQPERSGNQNMKQKRILIPTDGPESWKQLLAEPDKHWQLGYSVMSTAFSWETAGGIPNEVAVLFTRADELAIRDASLAIAIPEYKVRLAGGTRPSQNDVFALLTCSGGLMTATVEGKAREDFDELLGDWKKRTSPQGVKARLADIAEHIGLTMQIPDDIRYQLLHRTASAAIEARRFHAPYAAMIVQSFVTDDNENHYSDFCGFLRLYGKEATKGRLIELTKVKGCRLFAAWVHSRLK